MTKADWAKLRKILSEHRRMIRLDVQDAMRDVLVEEARMIMLTEAKRDADRGRIH